MKKISLAALVLWSVLPLAASAGEPAPSAAAGQPTREALELQRSGRAASDTARPMSGDIAERTHRRYAESFSQPIPESFKDEEQEFVKGSE